MYSRQEMYDLLLDIRNGVEKMTADLSLNSTEEEIVTKTLELIDYHIREAVG